MQEKILVVPAELCQFDGFTQLPQPQLLDPANHTFRPRDEVETDFNWKQLIPYHIIRWNDFFYHYTRGRTQGEKRLHGKRSIGIGGHINDKDGTYEYGANRELEEEVCIYGSKANKIIGFINDNSTSVGRVHIGVVHLIKLHVPLIVPREEDMLFAGFIPIGMLEEYESWSQIYLKAFNEKRIL